MEIDKNLILFKKVKNKGIFVHEISNDIIKVAENLDEVISKIM